MKKLLILLMALAFVAGFYATSDALLSGSAHDFRTTTWNTVAVGEGRLCNVCHVPHNADPGITCPLWNHTLSGATYAIYSSPTGTLDAGGGTIGQPNGVSKLCLSCHDGTVALDSFGGATGSTTIGTAANLGTDLSNDHPISFTYDGTLATSDGELVSPVSASSVEGNLPLFNSQMECGTCHDVHNTNVAGIKLLILSNTDSELCLACHNK